MTDVVIVAILSLVGTFIGSIGGIIASNRLITYRIDQLETKVNKHNNLIERVYNIENHEKLLDERLTNLRDRMEELHHEEH